MEQHKSMEERELALIESFELFDDSMEKYEHLIELGKSLAPLDSAFHNDEFLVKGCQSQVWLRAYTKEGKIYFEADSNTVITKGIISTLIEVLSGEDAVTITTHSLGFIDKIGLRGMLSSQRSNGLSAMILKMKWWAEFLSKETTISK
jgi:cysteine desulfuration protein SufE